MWYTTVPTGPRIADVFSDEVHPNKMGPIIWTLANCPTVGHIMNSVPEPISPEELWTVCLVWYQPKVVVHLWTPYVD